MQLLLVAHLDQFMDQMEGRDEAHAEARLRLGGSSKEAGGSARGRRRPSPFDAALGLDSVLGQGAEHRLKADQCPGRDGERQAFFPGRLARAALPDSGRQLRRVDPQGREEAAMAVRAEGQQTVCLRQAMGALDCRAARQLIDFT